MFETKVVNGIGDNNFRQYILQNKNTLFYSEPRFIQLISDHLNCDARWLSIYKKGSLVGLLPFLLKYGPLGTVLNSLAYFGSNGGVIQAKKDDEAKILLIEAFYEYARSIKAASATIITNPLENDFLLYDEHSSISFRDERIGQITHFPIIKDKSEIIKYFKDPRPRNIRRAMKEGVIVESGQEKYLDFLFETHNENMNEIGGLPKKREFFQKIPKLLNSKDWKIYSAFLDGKPIASLLLFYFNKTIEYFTPVILKDYRNTQALTLIIYQAMQDGMNSGFKNWNWGGTWLSQGGVYDFKKRWGTSEYRYYYYTKVLNNKIRYESKSLLEEDYSGFYVIPYKYLEKNNNV